MIDDMNLSRRTWIAAVKLAAIVSVLAALVAAAISQLGDLPEAAIVLPVIVVGFTASWVQTGRIRRQADELVTVPLRAIPRATAA